MTETYTDDHIKDILTRTKTIAIVGISAKEDRPSNEVAAYLKAKGYRIIPVNPGLEGQEMFGEPVRASLSDIEGPVDMVDIFRRSEAVGPVVDEALAALDGLGTVWMQLGVINEEAAEKARAAGVDVVMNRCPKIEYPRLMA